VNIPVFRVPFGFSDEFEDSLNKAKVGGDQGDRESRKLDLHLEQSDGWRIFVYANVTSFAACHFRHRSSRGISTGSGDLILISHRRRSRLRILQCAWGGKQLEQARWQYRFIRASRSLTRLMTLQKATANGRVELKWVPSGKS
jgi:hypothetical protein